MTAEWVDGIMILGDFEPKTPKRKGTHTSRASTCTISSHYPERNELSLPTDQSRHLKSNTTPLSWASMIRAGPSSISRTLICTCTCTCRFLLFNQIIFFEITNPVKKAFVNPTRPCTHNFLECGASVWVENAWLCYHTVVSAARTFSICFDRYCIFYIFAEGPKSRRMPSHEMKLIIYLVVSLILIT